MKQTDDYCFFWEGPLSQWHQCRFFVDGIEYNCAEQFMMAGKAKLFHDEAAYRNIMATSSPHEHKELGRCVKKFVKKTWHRHAREIVLIGNRAKFGQNPELAGILLDTKGKLVEASPYDTIWGIGLGEDDSRSLDEAQWRGLNWLGEVLTQVRDELEGSGAGSSGIEKNTKERLKND